MKNNNTRHGNNQEDFKQEIRDLGVQDTPNFNIDTGEIIRFGKNKKYALLFNGNFGFFQDWSEEVEGFRWFRNDGKTPISYEEIKALNEKRKEANDQRDEELSVQYEQASKKAISIWQGLQPVSNSLYLKNKGLSTINEDNLRLSNYQNKNYLVSALRDNDGKIWSLQFIEDANGKNKKFLPQSKTTGLYSEFGDLDSNLIYICEGLATGLSILLAKPESLVIIAYSCSRLAPVAVNIKQRFKEAKIIIAGDNDLSKKPNNGKEYAEKTAKEHNLQVVIPTFKNTETNPSDFNDLHQLEGLDEIRNQLDSFKAISKDEWEKPVEFNSFITPPIPTSLLPLPVKNFGKELATSTETPEGMTVLAIYASLATCLQGKFVVKPKEDADFQENLNLYTFTALPPANLKSAVLKACQKPILAYQQEQRKILEPEIVRQESMYLSEKTIIEGLRNKLKKDPSDELKKEIAEREAKLPKIDALPTFFTNDTTPESLAIALQQQNGKIAIFSDEGGIIETMSGLYSGGNANIDILLKGWDGGYVSQKRKDRDIKFHPLITINLTVQPVIINNMFGKRAFAGKGLLERFLYCLPKSNLGYRTHNKNSVSKKAIDIYDEVIGKLFSIPNPENPEILVLDKLAHQEWYDFKLAIEEDLKPNGRFESMQGWAGKLAGQALRIAGIIHVIENGESSSLISKETMEKALHLCSLLIDHAEAIFKTFDVQSDARQAKDIWDYISSLERASFTKAEITKKFQNIMNAKRIDELLSVLEERHYISKPTKEGKKTFIYKVNPLLLNSLLSNS